MNNSIFERLRPLTFSIGFLEAPLGTVADAVEEWRNEHHKSVNVVGVEETFEDALLMLAPLTTPQRRELYYETDSAWTAYFDNGASGGDPFGPISYLAEQLGSRGLTTTYIPHAVQKRAGREVGVPGAVKFELFAPERREWLNYERSVSLNFDNGGWRFDANGTVQPFEDIEKYNSRKKADRFTPEMLEQYCLALGVRLWNESFYGPKGVFVNIGDPLLAGSREYSLQEARNELGI